MKRILKLGAVFAAMLFISMAFVSAASAGAHKRYEISEEQLEVANQLVGQDITIGEFMEQVLPEALENMPEEAVEDMYTIKMVWPGPREPGSERDFPQNVTITSSRPSTDVQPQAVDVILYNFRSTISALWRVVSFSSSNQASIRVPYMWVYSLLYFEDGTIKDLDYDEGYNVDRVKASGSYFAWTAGYYQTRGMHYAEGPPDYYPPVIYAETQTDWKYVS